MNVLRPAALTATLVPMSLPVKIAGLMLTACLIFIIAWSGPSTARIVEVHDVTVVPKIQVRGYSNYEPHPDGRD